jgi:hypothetical protein
LRYRDEDKKSFFSNEG